MSAPASLKHQFLLAMPGMAEDWFGHSITFICEHNADGAMGIVVNRPSGLTLGELLEHLELPCQANLDLPVLDGGPVQRDRGFILHNHDPRFDNSLPLGQDLMLSTARDLLQAMGNGDGPERVLVALGYAGWGPGQLEQELADNAWLTCDADPTVLFDTPFDQRVQVAASRLGIDFNLIGGQPGHG